MWETTHSWVSYETSKSVFENSTSPSYVAGKVKLSPGSRSSHVTTSPWLSDSVLQFSEYSKDYNLNCHKMARRCAAANCEAVSHLFSWPKDPSTSSKWTSWVKLVVVNFEPSKHKRLCWRHFATEDFTNYSAYVNGFSSMWVLIMIDALASLL